jgi:hypothetical protein
MDPDMITEIDIEIAEPEPEDTEREEHCCPSPAVAAARFCGCWR